MSYGTGVPVPGGPEFKQNLEMMLAFVKSLRGESTHSIKVSIAARKMTPEDILSWHSCHPNYLLNVFIPLRTRKQWGLR